MSFEIKYNRDGEVIPQPQPQFVEQEVQEQPVEQEQPQQEVYEEEVADEPIVQEQPRKPAPQESWKNLREKAERAERRAAELEQALLDAQSAQQRPDEDVHVDDDSLVEGKHLSKVSKKIQNLEKQLRQYEQQSTVNSAEMRLKSKYPDFDSVVSVDNLDSLRDSYPEIAQTIDSSKDLYSKAVTAYTMIKQLGIAPQPDPFRAEKEIAQRNASKPKSLASISPQQGDSPLSKANAFANGSLTDEMKTQLWKEMQNYRK